MLATIDTARFQAFLAVAEHGSFTAAAAALHISQPAVSQHVAKLEREVGAVLLERSARRVVLTPAGEVLLHHARRLLTGLDDARRELAAVARADSGRLRLAVFPSAAATFVPAALARLLAAFPKVNVAMSELDPPLALPRLLGGDADMAVVYDYPIISGPPDPRLVREQLALDPMAVAVPAGTVLASRPEITPADLATHSWIAPGPSQCRDALDEACRRAAIAPRVVSETNDYQAMLRMVGAGIGIAVVPRMVAALAPAGTVVLRPLARTRLQRAVALVYRAQVALTPAMDLVRTLMAQAVQDEFAVPMPAAA
ncbi:LysR family transcriptional regulator [Actinocrinis puniceicyclus]|uniref:LysR family transcriptional regulator n=1 Tax=Actinocrinis puniceicyclus TaxID=977794 RepID=A0A8J7WPZ0_9ACTN|nr:LysR family transcriptional regulator [Actinocrinis puniceicyclus]MBS2966526.1 LysR family transcriptional regulator [Actinocrinis puniceicyclus]